MEQISVEFNNIYNSFTEQDAEVLYINNPNYEKHICWVADGKCIVFEEDRGGSSITIYKSVQEYKDRISCSDIEEDAERFNI